MRQPPPGVLAIGAAVVVTAMLSLFSCAPSRETPPVTPAPSPRPSVDLRVAATGAYGSDLTLVLGRVDGALHLEARAPDGTVRLLAATQIPSREPYLVVRQLVCAQSTGLDTRVVLFGRVAPIDAGRTLRVEGFTGPVATSVEGDFLFISHERAEAHKQWKVSVAGFPPVSSAVAMAGDRQDSTPGPSDLCAAFDPASIPPG